MSRLQRAVLGFICGLLLVSGAALLSGCSKRTPACEALEAQGLVIHHRGQPLYVIEVHASVAYVILPGHQRAIKVTCTMLAAHLE